MFDIPALALALAAVALTYRATRFASLAGSCTDCGYDLRGLGDQCRCPECGGTAERFVASRGLRAHAVGAVVALLMVAGVAATWPRFDRVIERMPSRMLLLADRLGNDKAIGVLTVRADDDELSASVLRIFVERAQGRVIADPGLFSGGDGDVGVMLLELALCGNVDAQRAVMTAMVLHGTDAARSVGRGVNVVRIRNCPVAELLRSFIQGDGSQSGAPDSWFVCGDHLWLQEAILNVFDGLTSDADACSLFQTVKLVYASPSACERVMECLECRPWPHVRCDAQAWLEQAPHDVSTGAMDR